MTLYYRLSDNKFVNTLKDAKAITQEEIDEAEGIALGSMLLDTHDELVNESIISDAHSDDVGSQYEEDPIAIPTEMNFSESNSTPTESSSSSSNPIKGFTKHGLNQAISRAGGENKSGVKNTSILDAVNNPKKITTSEKATVYKGKKATVVLNKDGKVITTSGSNRGTQTTPNPRISGGGKAQAPSQKASGTSYNPNLIK